MPDPSVSHTPHPARLSLLGRLALLLCLAGHPPPAEAQSAPREEAPPLFVAAATLLGTPPPKLFFRDADGEYRPFHIARYSRTGYNTVPATPNLQLYKEGRNEEGAAVWLPALTLSLDPDQSHTLFVFYPDAEGKTAMRRVPASAEAHPGSSAMILNGLRRPVAVEFAGEWFRLEPGAHHLSRIPVNERRFLRFAFEREGRDAYKSKAMAIRIGDSDTRVLIVVAARFDITQGPDGRSTTILKPEAHRLYDSPPRTAPAPGAAAMSRLGE